MIPDGEEVVDECPICGFEIGTDDCICGGLMHMTKVGEPSRMDILVGTGEDKSKAADDGMIWSE